MSAICSGNHDLYDFHSCPQLFRTPFRAVEIPPRKMLFKKTSYDTSATTHGAYASDYLCKDEVSGESLGKDDMDPYSSDHFRMYEFKVRRCTRSRSHDWTDCPFAHPGEKARRRDPLRYHYSGSVCPDYRRGSCDRGDGCEFSHGVFECWLHPSRYRTEACKDGKHCKRKVCFFAHSPRQLRVVPEASSVSEDNLNIGCCCTVCQSTISSPTSTLMSVCNVSPPLSPSLRSPPLSPASHHASTGRFSLLNYNSSGLRSFSSGLHGGDDITNDLINSFEDLNFIENDSSVLDNFSHEQNDNDASANNFYTRELNRSDALAANFFAHEWNNNDSWDDNSLGGSRTQTSSSLFGSKTIIGTEHLASKEKPANDEDPDIEWVNDLLA